VPGSARICSTRCIGAIAARCIGTIGMVYPGTLFHRRQRGITMHSYETRSQSRALRRRQQAGRAAHRQQDHANDHCPGRKPAFLVFKRPTRPYKSPIQKPIYIGKREGRLNVPEGPNR
jgi:hypothetical protein